jgi:hypothetical protein
MNLPQDQVVTVEVCDDPLEMHRVEASGVEDCQRCGENGIAAMLKFPQLPMLEYLAICCYCYQDLTKSLLAQVI